MTRARSGANDHTESPTLKDFFIAAYLPHARAHKRSWQVDERLARCHIMPVIGHIKLDELSGINVEAWFDNLVLAGKLASSSCNRVLAVLKTVCNYAIKLNIVPATKNPCKDVAPLPVIQREKYLSQEEMTRLLNKLRGDSSQAAIILLILLLTGARKNEILKARWENLNLAQRQLTVPVSKSGKPRQIQFSPQAIALLETLPSRNEQGWIFPGRNTSKPSSDIFKFWDKIRRELGLTDVRIHDLRHTFASLLVNSGHTLYETQMLLGHATPRVTMRYAHLLDGTMQRAVEKVEKLVFGVMKPPRQKVRLKRKPRRASPVPMFGGRRSLMAKWRK